MTHDLFGAQDCQRHSLGAQALVLRGFALPFVDELVPALQRVAETSSFRHMVTPGGFSMSVAMTNCGHLGWTTDRRGYRYTEVDPDSGALWPAMPETFLVLAQTAAEAAGFSDFRPDACLVNRYIPGSRLTLHQDRNERDFNAPIVSVSLGLPAVFLFGGWHEATRQLEFRSCMETWLYGAGRIDSVITGCSLSRTACIPCWVLSVLISRFERPARDAQSARN